MYIYICAYTHFEILQSSEVQLWCSKASVQPDLHGWHGIGLGWCSFDWTCHLGAGSTIFQPSEVAKVALCSIPSSSPGLSVPCTWSQKPQRCRRKWIHMTFACFCCDVLDVLAFSVILRQTSTSFSLVSSFAYRMVQWCGRKHPGKPMHEPCWSVLYSAELWGPAPWYPLSESCFGLPSRIGFHANACKCYMILSESYPITLGTFGIQTVLQELDTELMGM
jgi:hypothetical protein